MALISIFSSCNWDLKNWIKNFEEKNFSESSKIFKEILEKNHSDEKILFDYGNSLYKEKKFSKAEKIFKEISKTWKISDLKKSWKIEYQIWNAKYKIWDELENPKKLSVQRKMQKVFWKNFDKIIENYKESIANYKLWIEKNNQNKESKNYKFLDTILKENLAFVEKKLEKTEKEKQKQDKKDWKNQEKNKKSWENKTEQPKKNQLNQDDFQKLQNQLKKLNQEEVQLKWSFNRFWKNNFRLKNEPNKMQMESLEEFLKKEKDKKEKIFDSGMKDW